MTDYYRLGHEHLHRVTVGTGHAKCICGWARDFNTYQAAKEGSDMHLDQMVKAELAKRPKLLADQSPKPLDSEINKVQESAQRLKDMGSVTPISPNVLGAVIIGPGYAFCNVPGCDWRRENQSREALRQAATRHNADFHNPQNVRPKQSPLFMFTLGRYTLSLIRSNV